MLKGLRFRPAGWVAAIGTVGAMAATMVIAAPGGAATPEKEFTTSFKAECVIGPGNLNQKGTLEVVTRSKGPESVIDGQEFEPHESTSTITSPVELANTLYHLGVRTVKGKVTNFDLNDIGLTPEVLNIAEPFAFPEGLPYEAPVEEGKNTVLTVPHEGNYSFGPYQVVGASGSNAELEVNSEAGFTEIGPTGSGEYEATGKGIVTTLEGLSESGAHVIGPLTVACTAPKGVVLASIPIEPGGTTHTTGTNSCSTTSAPSGGPVAGWGYNISGDLGNCTTTNAGTPVAVALSGAIAVATGFEHSLALLANGTVVDWGDDSAGQLGNGTSAGSEGCGFGEKHPCSTRPVPVPALSNVVAVAGGFGHSLALLSNGTVMAWGENSLGQLGNGTTTNSDVPVKVNGLSEVVAVAAGFFHNLALLKNGTVMAWGHSFQGQLGDGTTSGPESCGPGAAPCSMKPVPVSNLSGAVAVAANGEHSAALLANGTVVDWGENSAGQLGNGTTEQSDVPVEVKGLNEVAAIAAGGSTDYALKRDGTVMSWGEGQGGSLGDGKLENSDVPVPVSGLSGVTAIASGLALLGSGELRAWGRGEDGDLGDGKFENSDVPVPVSGLTGVSAIASGNHSLALGGTLTTLPSVTKVEPALGFPSGGTAVTITGANLTGATGVKFGSAAAASFTIESSTTIKAVSPPGSGTVDITVTTPTGTSALSAFGRFGYSPCPIPTEVTAIEPSHGSFEGGTTVQIMGRGFECASAVEFGGRPAKSFTVTSPTSIIAVTPFFPIVVPYFAPVFVRTSEGKGGGGASFRFEPPSMTTTTTSSRSTASRVNFENWKLTGSLTDKKLGQAITLPEGSTFNGSGELNTETGAGSVSGNLAIPAFTAQLKLLGILPLELGMKLTPEGSIAGTVAKSETVSGDETLTVPVKLGMGITSISLLGLKIPTTCATTERLSLSLVDNLTREELLTKGWSFSGSTTIPKIKCEGGLLGGLFGAVLSALLSGPENAYGIKITAPVV
jgi:alpha-tubulin suppressor-like RCC1 family protein